MYRKLAAVAVAGLVGALALAGVAHAQEQAPVSIDQSGPDECGVMTLTASWTDAASNPQDNARLVVDDGTDVQVAGVGEPITAGPFDTETATIRWRVFGGGERDYDSPLWNGHGEPSFKDDINAYIDTNGDAWLVGDAGDPFTTWHELDVKGCPPDPKPTSPAPGEGGGDEALPDTSGVSLLPALLGGGLLLLVAGAVAMVASRRRAIG